MLNQLYFPFKELNFDDEICFLTGAPATDSVTVFPRFLRKRFGLDDEEFELMNKHEKFLYKNLKLPCAAEVKTAILQLDREVELAFAKGYEGMQQLDELKLFQWVSRIVYGVLYHELVFERKRAAKYNKEYGVSPFLKERYGMFHLMLQSLVRPINFGARKPWDLFVFKLKYSADIFNYRDDAVNLLFTLGINGFGFIICLQHNGVLKEHFQELLDKIGTHVLHPVQYEELFAKFHYADYILQYRPEYEMSETDEGLLITALPIAANESRPLFGFWDDDTYAQLLANYWGVYGFEKKDVIKFQKPPMSFLEKPYTKDFILPESIKLPF